MQDGRRHVGRRVTFGEETFHDPRIGWKRPGGDCLAQPAPGRETLLNPEPGFYILGSKSYGRGSAFLLKIGYEQVAALGKF